MKCQGGTEQDKAKQRMINFKITTATLLVDIPPTIYVPTHLILSMQFLIDPPQNLTLNLVHDCSLGFYCVLKLKDDDFND